MINKLTIVVPMAGYGTRMRPHTWSKPKPLISVAGKTSLDHLIEGFSSLPEDIEIQYAFIVSPYLGEEQIPAFMKEHYPETKAGYVVQADMRGQSDALYLAKDFLKGPILVIYSDTLIKTDFSKLGNETLGGIAWVKSVEDPRRFGVAEINEEKIIKRLIEKPASVENDLAVVGCYYFRSGEDLVSAIEEQFERDLQLRGEYFLVDAVNIMIERGLRMRVQTVDTWLDTGTIDATLETNGRLLLTNKNLPIPEVMCKLLHQCLFIRKHTSPTPRSVPMFQSVPTVKLQKAKLKTALLKKEPK